MWLSWAKVRDTGKRLFDAEARMRPPLLSMLLRIDHITRGRWLRVTAGLLTVAILVTYPLSFWWVVSFQHRSQRFEAFIRYGMLHVNVYPQDFLRQAAQEAVQNPTATANPLLWWRPGFRVNPTVSTRPGLLSLRLLRPMPGTWILEFPLHLPLIVTAVLLLYPHLAFIRRARLRERGLCVNCGYDLRGSMSGVCPGVQILFDTCWHVKYPPWLFRSLWTMEGTQ